MEYKMNLGSWNSVFAVPGDIVDKHLRLAGAAQLKVILWTLRHAGEEFTIAGTEKKSGGPGEKTRFSANSI